MPEVRAVVALRLRSLANRMKGPVTAWDLAHRALIAADIERFLSRPFAHARPVASPAAPPGAPIGTLGPAFLSADEDWCGTAPRPRPFYAPLVAR